MRNKSLVIIVSLFLFTLISLGANMDARPLKTKVLMEDNQSQDITAIIEVR